MKQHLSNTWNSIHENLSNPEAELKKSVSYKKACILFSTFEQVQTSKTRETINVQQLRLFIIFLMGIFLNHLWLIPNILKWQDSKIFTKLVPSQTLLRSSHRRCSVKKGVFKNLQKFTGKHLCCSLFLIKLQVFRPATLLNSDSDTDVFLWIFTKHLFWRTSANDCFCSS